MIVGLRGAVVSQVRLRFYFLFMLWISLLKMDRDVGEGVLANIPSSPNISVCETG